jgi:uncharacterized membrane protein YhdT
MNTFFLSSIIVLSTILVIPLLIAVIIVRKNGITSSGAVRGFWAMTSMLFFPVGVLSVIFFVDILPEYTFDWSQWFAYACFLGYITIVYFILRYVVRRAVENDVEGSRPVHP